MDILGIVHCSEIVSAKEQSMDLLHPLEQQMGNSEVFLGQALQRVLRVVHYTHGPFSNLVLLSVMLASLPGARKGLQSFFGSGEDEGSEFGVQECTGGAWCVATALSLVPAVI